MPATAAMPLPDPKDQALMRHLGHAGLIPFVLLALLLWVLTGELQAFVSIALAGYGALIVSFLGGIHWGIAWQQQMRMGASSAPTLEEVDGVWVSNQESSNRPLKKCSSNAPGSRISKKQVAQTRLRNECEGHFGLFAGRFARFGRTYPMAHA